MILRKYTPVEIYYYKEQGYDSHQVPAVHNFSRRAVMDEKALSRLFPIGGGGGGGCGGHFLQMTGALQRKRLLE